MLDLTTGPLRDYVASLRPEHRSYVPEALTMSEGGNIHLQSPVVSGVSYAVQEAIVWDLRALTSGSFRADRYLVHQERQSGIHRKRLNTMAKARSIYGPGFDKEGKPKDTQRSKVYAAERAVIQDWPGQRTFTTVADMQSYVDKLLASAWWRRRHPKCRKVEVRNGAGHRAAVSYGGVIHMPKWSRVESVLLHELAHEAHGFEDHRVAPHGREFCRTYLELIRHRMGDDAWKALKAEFKTHKVKATLPRKMSAEQKTAAGQRLKAARKR